MYKTLKDWEARRSGAGMSVTGIDLETGAPVKLTDIVLICNSFHVGCYQAMARDGTPHQLVVELVAQGGLVHTDSRQPRRNAP